MLQHLTIKDFVVVSFADLNFNSGMTVITGETGSGKSVILDALAIVLGYRADSHLIRPGAPFAEISAIFDIRSLPYAIVWLTDNALCLQQEEPCLIRRILYPNGRSRAFINQHPVTTQQLRLFGEYLVQIHGQHQHQTLVKPIEQCRLLDAFGQHDQLVSQVNTAYKEWEDLNHQLDVLSKNQQHLQAKNELLHYQIQELETLNLQKNEIEVLHQEHDELANAQSFIEATEQILQLLSDGEQGNALSCITKAQPLVAQLSKKNPTLHNAISCLENCRIQLQEAIHDVDDYLQKLEINPERLQEIELRLQRIYEMARKHKIEPENLERHFQALLKQAHDTETFNEKQQVIAQNIQLAQQQYHQYAKKLSNARHKSARLLAQELTAHIQTLAMPGALFTIDLLSHPDHEQQLHPNGNESVQFSISANPGHPPLPLNKVASGGELSRISLALQCIMQKYCKTPCLVFDEVDVGISGKTGAIVGKSLQTLAQHTQVLCITHLPQVAAFGEHHLHVVKNLHHSQTQTDIRELNAEQRIEEMARMLGGIDISEQARANAKQLLDKHTADAI